MGFSGMPIRDQILELRALGVEEATFHPDGELASVKLLPTAPARSFEGPDHARVETPEEQKVRLDALLFASA